MKILKETKKITLSTLKAFAKRNEGNLFVKTNSSFDGMSDCVESRKESFKPTTITDEVWHYKTGIQGIYTVGSSRDYFCIYEDDTYFGIEVSNCCGVTVLVTKK